MQGLDLKFFGGLLLIIGTSLGGGMLALPMAVAEVGFPISVMYLITIWAVMTFAAFLILEVNLALPPRSNMISMAYMTLGNTGRVFAWLVYLFLLYILLAAYLAGGSDVLQSLTHLVSVNLPHWQNVVLFLILLGSVIVSGMAMVDHVNSLLMFAKLGVYLLLIIFIGSKVNLNYLNFSHSSIRLEPIMVMVTSFGFAIVIPSLRNYFQDDVPKLRKVIFFGSFVPLICYVLWDAVIMGVIPRHGEHGLLVLKQSQHTTVELINILNVQLENNWLTGLFRSFSALSMLTTFLGVGLSLTDFLADGLHISKHGKEGIAIYAISFLPPLLIVLFRPDTFLFAIEYAGIFVVLLLITLPILMAWSARYVTNLESTYRVAGGRLSLIISGLCSIILLTIGLFFRI